MSSTAPAETRVGLSASREVVRAGLWGRLGRWIRWPAAGAPWLLVGLLAWTHRPYWLDLASHFLLHAGVMCLLAGAALLIARCRIVGTSCLLAGLAVAAGWRMSASAPSGVDATNRPRPSVRIVFFNAHEEVSRHDNDAFAWIRDQNPDAIVIIEPPWALLEDYPFLRRDFPHVVEPQPGMLWSILLLSRWPAQVEPLAPYADEIKFSFVARRSLLVSHPAGERFILTAMHPPSPRTPATWRRSIGEVGRDGGIIRQWAERSALPIVVVGDFNSTPVGRVHRTFARASRLRGWSPWVGGGTWPARMPPWLSLPIDRAWTGYGAAVRTMKVGPCFRSDHRPVVVDIVLRDGKGSGDSSAPEQTPFDPSPIESPGGSTR